MVPALKFSTTTSVVSMSRLIKLTASGDFKLSVKLRLLAFMVKNEGDWF